MNDFNRDHFTIQRNGGMGFIAAVAGAVGQIGSSALQYKASKEAGKAASTGLKAAKAEGKTQVRIAELQVQAAKAAAAAEAKKGKMPKWVLPVAIGAGVLILGGLGWYFLKKK